MKIILKYPIAVLARRTSNIEPLTSLGAEIAYGDILEGASVEAAMGGCDTLCHAAALYDFWVPEKQLMMQTEEEWFGLACQLTSTKRPPFGPVFPARLMAYLGDFASRWTHRPPLVSRDNIEIVVHGFRVDGSKAIEELGIKYTPLDEGMRKTLDWYWQQGLLSHRPACIV